MAPGCAHLALLFVELHEAPKLDVELILHLALKLCRAPLLKQLRFT